MSSTLVASSRTAIKTLLSAICTKTIDVKELTFQGSNYGYPCVRYTVDLSRSDCGYAGVLTVYCWSEDISSLEVSQMIDEFVAKLPGKTSTSGGIRVQNFAVQRIPAPMRRDRLWRSDATFDFKAA